MNSLTSKHYSRELSRRATESMRRKAEDGVYPTRPALGYVNVRPKTADGQTRDRGGTNELTPWGRKLVRRARELRIEGCSFKLIAELLVKEGLVLSNKLKGFTGPGRVARVEKILKDPFYVGRFRWAGEWYIGTHERVFTDAEWESLQATFNRTPAAKRDTKEPHALAGLLRCGECSCRVTPEIKRKGGKVYPYLRLCERKEAAREAHVRAGIDHYGRARQSRRCHPHRRGDRGAGCQGPERLARGSPREPAAQGDPV